MITIELARAAHAERLVVAERAARHPVPRRRRRWLRQPS
jgi:hypothetical protein